MDQNTTPTQNGDNSTLLEKGTEAFGSWVNNLETLNKEFINAKPFPNVEIDNFFKPEIAEALYKVFPKTTDDQKWVIYNNPIEKKYALTDFSSLPQFKDLFDLLQTNQFVELIKKISGIDNLESDPHLHGAGLHQHVPGGKLDMHLDYSIHPISGKERRVNLIIYFTKDWEDDYGGAIQLWNEDFSACEKKLSPCFNKAILFRTSDVSYHGLPLPIKCPEGNSRKSIAIYYVSDPRPDLVNVRYKAHFRPLPTQPVNDKLEQLYRIREKRTITKDDLATIYPDWETDGNGFW
jgi:Rps23 Pro-64 3,4-dihydroxylase Tpa1-like proline 4-hydroxylase